MSLRGARQGDVAISKHRTLKLHHFAQDGISGGTLPASDMARNEGKKRSLHKSRGDCFASLAMTCRGKKEIASLRSA